jgi:deoxyribodipyrimidine photolyase
MLVAPSCHPSLCDNARQPVAGYPEPIVDHGLARELALAAYAEIKKEPQ